MINYKDYSREALIEELVMLRHRLECSEREGGAEQLSDLYDFAPVGYLTLDTQGRIEGLNLTAAGMLGLPRSKLIGRLFSDWLGDADVEHFNHFLRELQIAGHRVVSGLQLKSEFHIDRYLQLHGSRVEDGSGAPAQYRVAMIDVTAGRIADQALRQSEGRYRSLFDDSPLPLWEVDLSLVHAYLAGIMDEHPVTLAEAPRRYRPVIHQCIRRLRFPNANRAALELTGIESREEMQRAYPALLTTRSWRTLAAMMDALWRGATQFVAETSLRRCDGAIREVILHVNVAPGRGDTLARVVIAMIDVSERQLAERRLRASEQRFRALVEQSPTSTLLFRPNGLLKEVNPACLARWRVTPEQLQGYNIFEDKQLLANELMPEIRRGFSGEAVSASEFEYDPNEQFGTGGQRAWVRRHIYPVRVGDTIAEVVVRDEDVTKEHLARDEARRRQEELVHVARLSVMGEMASSLAHEVSQPLMAILTYADACMEMIETTDCNPALLKRPLLEIAAQASRASEIVRRIRGFVRREAPLRVAADINQLIEEALQILDAEIRQSGLHVYRELEEKLPAAAVDPVQIVQVLVNLVHNALDALRGVPTEKRNLTLRTRQLDKHTLRVECIDTGSGIDEDARERLFDPFYTTKQRGMGMGLSISRTIIESHGGHLTAESTPELGTVVGFDLPLGGHGAAGDKRP